MQTPGSNSVSVIDTSNNNALIAKIAVGPNPTAIAFDYINGLIYVVNGGSNYVSVINGSTNQVVANVVVGNLPVGIAIDSTNGDIYVTNSLDATVSVIGGSTNTVVSTVSAYLGDPQGIAFIPINGYLYVVSESGSDFCD